MAGHASAYFFDAPEQNLRLSLHGSSIPAFGSGTLGYVNVQSAEEPEFIGASGFLLAQVGPYKPAEKRANVSVELIPEIGEGEHGEGELALEAQQGTLLRRSQVAMFAGLARRPRAGNEGPGESESESLSYVFTPIPANCVGAICPASGGPGLLPRILVHLLQRRSREVRSARTDTPPNRTPLSSMSTKNRSSKQASDRRRAWSNRNRACSAP